jgi:hypothetical protein
MRLVGGPLPFGFRLSLYELLVMHLRMILRSRLIVMHLRVILGNGLLVVHLRMILGQ